MAKEEYIWAIGDIHGHSLSLKAILEKIEQYNNKTLIFLGDYIDRGPNPKEVLDIIMSLNNKIALMGEHEYLLLSSLEGEQQKPEIILEWSKYGYETTLKDFEASDVESLNKNLDAKYKDFLQSLAIFHTEKFSSSKKDFDLLFSHAGPFPDIPLSEQLNIKNFKDYNSFLESKRLGIFDGCLFNNDKILQKSFSTWDNYLLIHGHIRTQYRQNRNRLKYTGGEHKYNFDFSDIPNPLYFPGGSAVASLDIDTGVDVGGKLSAIGLSFENIDFNKGRIILKVIQADSSRRNRNIRPVVFDLTLPFTDEVSWFNRIIKKFYRKKHHH